MVTHCLLVEGDAGLTLVDTGFGTDDVAEGARRLGRAFTTLFGAAAGPLRDGATRSWPPWGSTPTDVHDIVVTHLDLDHAGGLADFPHARVHVHRAELDAALHPALRDRARYLQAQWGHGPHWVEHSTGGDEWFGFASTQAVGEDVVMVPLHGHSRGHCGVAVRRPGGGWLLHAGDAYFHSGDLERPRRCPPALRAFQRAAGRPTRRRAGRTWPGCSSCAPSAPTRSRCSARTTAERASRPLSARLDSPHDHPSRHRRRLRGRRPRSGADARRRTATSSRSSSSTAQLPVVEPVDIALYDTFAQTQGNGPDVAELLANPSVRHVVVYTWNVEDRLVKETLEQGVSGYLSKALTADELVEALRAVHAGEQVVAPQPVPESTRARERLPGREPRG